MSRRYIVCIEGHSVAQDNQVMSFFKELKLGWWHWFNNVWLVVDVKGITNCEMIRNKIMEIYPGLRCIVIELNEKGDTWAGFGPSSESKNMFKWIRESWKKIKK